MFVNIAARKSFGVHLMSVVANGFFELIGTCNLCLIKKDDDIDLGDMRIKPVMKKTLMLTARPRQTSLNNMDVFCEERATLSIGAEKKGLEFLSTLKRLSVHTNIDGIEELLAHISIAFQPSKQAHFQLALFRR